MSKFRNERFDCVECGAFDSVESLDHVLCPKCLEKALRETCTYCGQSHHPAYFVGDKCVVCCTSQEIANGKVSE